MFSFRPFTYSLTLLIIELNEPRLWLEKNEQGSTAAYLSLSPVFDLPPSTDKEVILMIDRSESMRSEIAILKQALHQCLTELAKKRTQHVTFNIVAFGSVYHHLFAQYVARFIISLSLSGQR